MTLDNAPPISIEPLPRSQAIVTPATSQMELIPTGEEVMVPQPTEPPALFETPRDDAFDPNTFNLRVHGRR